MRILSLSLAAVFLAAAAPAAHADTMKAANGKVTGVRLRGEAKPDYASAVPMRLPAPLGAAPSVRDILLGAQSATFDDAPRFFEGGEGDGSRALEIVPTPKRQQAADEAAAPPPPEYGASGIPYSTALIPDASEPNYRPAAKVFFKDGADTFICSASLIKRGVAITAAHCVSKFGENRFYSDVRVIPAYRNGAAPFGNWQAHDIWVMTSYLNGSDTCSQRGVICHNDIAVILLKPKKGKYPGDRTGWFGFGINGLGYTPDNLVQITQLGYPGQLNSGERMIRNDSQGAIAPNFADNTMIGSLLTGGSSGGPWIANFGDATKLNAGVKRGKESNRNIVVGVTSWGSTDLSANGPKFQGASRFTNRNVPLMVNAACDSAPAACR